MVGWSASPVQGKEATMTARCSWLLAGFMALNAANAADPAESVRFADDFSKNTLTSYETEGDIAWKKSELTLGKKARLVRKLDLGHRASVWAVISVPGGNAAEGLAVA